MSRQSILRRVRNERERSGDKGMTLVELIVAMGILTVVIVVFMAGVAAMSRTTVRTEVASNSNDQFRKLFQQMDREVRYATDINRPGNGAGGAIYIEYRYIDDGADSIPKCVQLRYNTSTAELQRRTWPETNPASVTGWSTYVTKLRNDLSQESQTPFVFSRAGLDTSSGVTYINQRLTLNLSSGLGESRDGRGSELQTTFVARNSSDQSVTNIDSNGDGATDSPVCLAGVSRS